MDKRRIRDFLLLKPAVSSRNLTSLLLVAIFFGVYVAAGGKVSTIPEVAPGEGFGTVTSNQVSDTEGYEEEAVEIEEPVRKKVTRTKKRTAKKSRVSRKRVVEPVEEIDDVEEEEAFEEAEEISDDDLSSIEKRLKLNR